MHIGTNIRRIRREAGISLEELADRTKISTPVLSRIELGQRSAPNRAERAKIARALGVSPIELEAVAVHTGDGVAVVGDAMSPTLTEGDVAYFTDARLGPEIEGRVVLVTFDARRSEGRTVARAWLEGSTVVLTRDNVRARPLLVPRDQIAGVAVLTERRTNRF